MDFQKGIIKTRKTILDSVPHNAFLVIIPISIAFLYLPVFLLQFPGQEGIFLQMKLRFAEDKPLLDKTENCTTSRFRLYAILISFYENTARQMDRRLKSDYQYLQDLQSVK